ncbi:MAG TPA: hypothetical protein VF777_15300 [Phycisphaerales bacterium]
MIRSARLLIVASSLCCGMSFAQNNPAPKPLAPAAGALEFNPKPFRIESMGLTISLPKDANASSTTIGAQAALEIIGPGNQWYVAARIVESSDLKLSLADVAETNLRAQMGEGVLMVGNVGSSGATLMERTQNLQIGTLPAERFYVLGPQDPDPKKMRLIYGVTFIKLGPGRFAYFETSLGEAQFERARAQIEATVATAQFADKPALEAAQRALFDAGAKFLETVDEAKLRAVVADSKETWWRLYIPSKTGADADAKELGYRRIRISMGKRGEIDPSRDPKEFRGADLDEGYLVKVDFRGILGDNNEVLTDSRGTFFLSLDRSQETWALTTRVRDGKSDKVSDEIGYRVGSQIKLKKADGRDATLLVPDKAYVSRLETFLLHRLLVLSRLTTEFAFYTYSSETELVDIRRESVEQPVDKPGIYRITSRLGEGNQPQVATIKANGDLLFADLGGGVRIEPTSLEQLIRLWKSKGLPLD